MSAWGWGNSVNVNALYQLSTLIRNIKYLASRDPELAEALDKLFTFTYDAYNENKNRSYASISDETPGWKAVENIEQKMESFIRKAGENTLLCRHLKHLDKLLKDAREERLHLNPYSSDNYGKIGEFLSYTRTIGRGAMKYDKAGQKLEQTLNRLHLTDIWELTDELEEDYHKLKNYFAHGKDELRAGIRDKLGRLKTHLQEAAKVPYDDHEIIKLFGSAETAKKRLTGGVTIDRMLRLVEFEEKFMASAMPLEEQSSVENFRGCADQIDDIIRNKISTVVKEGPELKQLRRDLQAYRDKLEAFPAENKKDDIQKYYREADQALTKIQQQCFRILNHAELQKPDQKRTMEDLQLGRVMSSIATLRDGESSHVSKSQAMDDSFKRLEMVTTVKSNFRNYLAKLNEAEQEKFPGKFSKGFDLMKKQVEALINLDEMDCSNEQFMARYYACVNSAKSFKLAQWFPDSAKGPDRKALDVTQSIMDDESFRYFSEESRKLFRKNKGSGLVVEGLPAEKAGEDLDPQKREQLNALDDKVQALKTGITDIETRYKRNEGSRTTVGSVYRQEMYAAIRDLRTLGDRGTPQQYIAALQRLKEASKDYIKQHRFAIRPYMRESRNIAQACVDFANQQLGQLQPYAEIDWIKKGVAQTKAFYDTAPAQEGAQIVNQHQQIKENEKVKDTNLRKLSEKIIGPKPENKIPNVQPKIPVKGVGVPVLGGQNPSALMSNH